MQSLPHPCISVVKHASRLMIKTPIYRTMSSSSTPSDSKSQPDQLLSLPSASSDPQTTTIDMSAGGKTVKLDHLGPLVVNKDGSLSRIENWSQMSEVEKQNTVRILGKRNAARREALLQAGRGGEEGK
jgi:hypothetical protein